MLEKEKKITRQYRIAESIVNELSETANTTGKSKTTIIEEALIQYFKTNKQDEYEMIADRFLEKFSEKYAAYMTRMRLGVRTAEINSQLQMEIINTLLFVKNIKRESYVSTDMMEAPLMTEAKSTVKNRIERAKQKKDHART